MSSSSSFFDFKEITLYKVCVIYISNSLCYCVISPSIAEINIPVFKEKLLEKNYSEINPDSLTDLNDGKFFVIEKSGFNFKKVFDKYLDSDFYLSCSFNKVKVLRLPDDLNKISLIKDLLA